jgi:phosphatidylglycerophosphate synthase
MWLLALQGVIGAFDTLYYHEWRARLPARRSVAAPELKLHAARDFLYAVLFGTLPWVAWHGVWAAVLVAILVAEIVLTMADFVTEIGVRRSLGDVYAGERVTHAVMGLVYGAMIAVLLPALWTWSQQPTALRLAPAAVPAALRWTLVVMAVGVLVSGVRDLYAAARLPHGDWPWTVDHAM